MQKSFTPIILSPGCLVIYFTLPSNHLTGGLLTSHKIMFQRHSLNTHSNNFAAESLPTFESDALPSLQINVHANPSYRQNVGCYKYPSWYGWSSARHCLEQCLVFSQNLIEFVVESLLIVTESSSPDSKERRTQVSVSVELSDDAASSALSIFDRAVQPSSWQG